MDLLRTAFRLVVMLAVLGIGYKAWQVYGPPAEQLRSLALRALDAARSALDGSSANDAEGGLNTAPRPIASPLSAQPLAPAAPTGQVLQTQALEPAGSAPSLTAIAPPALVQPPSRLPPTEPSAELVAAGGQVAGGNDPQLKALYSQLESLSARGLQLTEWGNSGQMYRFSCQAPLAGAANFNRHFEAVAADPQAAVAEVVAKMSAWRTAERGTADPETTLR